MKSYFYHDGIKENGPILIDDLISLNLTKETPIWYEGLPNWTKAENIDELKFLFKPKITPPPLTSSNQFPPINPQFNNEIDKPKSKNKYLFLSLVILGILILCGIITYFALKATPTDDYSEAVKKYSNDESNNTTSISNSRKIAEEVQNQNNQKEQEAKAEKERINSELTQKYMGFRNNWRNFITTTTNSYNYSEIGGISNLEIIVSNETDKKIDEVQVRIDYIKANGGTWKSETVSITNISPNSNKSVSAPSSERGTSVNIEIDNISAPTFHFCYPYGNGESNTDPYFCK
jgi:GYF domain 2